MNARLLFELLDRIQINLLDCQSVQPAVQLNIELQHLIVGETMLDMDHTVFHHVAFCHHRCQDLSFIYDRELNELQPGSMILRAGDHRGIIGIHRQITNKLFQKHLELILPLDHHVLHLRNLRLLLIHQPVYIKPVSSIRRNTSGRCMRLNDQPHIFQIGHLVADRGGTEIQIRKL